jgi:hypothetical protein
MLIVCCLCLSGVCEPSYNFEPFLTSGWSFNDRRNLKNWHLGHLFFRYSISNKFSVFLCCKNLSRYCNGLNSSSFPAGCAINPWAILNQYGTRIGIEISGENNLEVRLLEYRDRFLGYYNIGIGSISNIIFVCLSC